MDQIKISIRISADEYLKHYQGAAKSVFTQSVDGRSIRFPAKILQPFVTHNGIEGSFIIQFDDNKQFKEIIKIDC